MSDFMHVVLFLYVYSWSVGNSGPPSAKFRFPGRRRLQSSNKGRWLAAQRHVGSNNLSWVTTDWEKKCLRPGKESACVTGKLKYSELATQEANFNLNASFCMRQRWQIELLRPLQSWPTWEKKFCPPSLYKAPAFRTRNQFAREEGPGTGSWQQIADVSSTHAQSRKWWTKTHVYLFPPWFLGFFSSLHAIQSVSCA